MKRLVSGVFCAVFACAGAFAAGLTNGYTQVVHRGGCGRAGDGGAEKLM